MIHNKTIPHLIEEYCGYLEMRAYATGTIRNTRQILGRFNLWCAGLQWTRPQQVTHHRMKRYQYVLYEYRKRNGEPLSLSCQRVRLITIKGFYKWLCREHGLKGNPAENLELPRLGTRLPRTVFSAQETEHILKQTQIQTARGLRDRTMMEILYACGVRRAELAALQLYDIDLERQTLFVCNGKGRKDRVLPLGARAVKWIRRYLRQSRNKLISDSNESALFIRNDGLAMTSPTLGNIVHAYIKKADIGKSGSCHLFRHTVATLMLENGADIRYVQELLGHARLQTTEIYTHVNISKLMEVHRLTHPALIKKP